jgi:hypothetical protein
MEPTRFEFTPEQKGMLASLSRETGKPVPALIAQALEELQAHERLPHTYGGTNGGGEQPRKKRLGEIAEELFRDIPEEELARLPVDGAAQHDHYIYGLPKRPT